MLKHGRNDNDIAGEKTWSMGIVSWCVREHSECNSMSWRCQRPICTLLVLCGSDVNNHGIHLLFHEFLQFSTFSAPESLRWAQKQQACRMMLIAAYMEDCSSDVFFVISWGPNLGSLFFRTCASHILQIANPIFSGAALLGSQIRIGMMHMVYCLFCAKFLNFV